MLRFPSGEDWSIATDAHKALFPLLSFRQVPRVPVALSCSLSASFSRNLAVPTVLSVGCCPQRRSTLQKSLQSPGGSAHLTSPLQHQHPVPELLPSPAAERCFGDTSPLPWFFLFFFLFTSVMIQWIISYYFSPLLRTAQEGGLTDSPNSGQRNMMPSRWSLGLYFCSCVGSLKSSCLLLVSSDQGQRESNCRSQRGCSAQMCGKTQL